MSHRPAVADKSGQTLARRRSLSAQLPLPVRTVLGTEAGSAALLLFATIVALTWANSPWSASYSSLWEARISITLASWSSSTNIGHLISDGLMALFFFVVGLEVRREFSAGELTAPRRAGLAVAAAIGGLALPAVIYLLIIRGEAEAAGGWGVVIGTDTAFVLGALALVGPMFVTQLRVFLLTATVVDDIVAVSVIGVFYTQGLDLVSLAGVVLLAGGMALMSRMGVWRVMPYVVFGAALWVASARAGLHATIAGMLGGLLVAAPSPARDAVEAAALRFRAFRQSPHVEMGRAAREGVMAAVSVNERLQAVLHPWSSYVIVPLFALAHAGVDLRGGVLQDALASRLTWAVVVALVIGKLCGMGAASWLVLRTGLGTLPVGVSLGHVFAGAALSGIGFTVALLIVGLAFQDAGLRAQAVVGVLLAAVLATGLGWAAFKVTALLAGHTDADLPRVLDRPVEPGTDHLLGPADAPLTLVEYGDFECPFCARATGVTRELRDRFGEELRYVFRHLPLVDVHPHAEMAARAAVAADKQGRFWDMHDKLFEHQDEQEYEDIAGYAAVLGLDVERFLRDLESRETEARVRADVASAEASGARGTPTFFIGDVRHTGPHDAETLARALMAARGTVSSSSSRT